MKVFAACSLTVLCLLPVAGNLCAQTPGCGDGSTLKDTYSPADTRRAEHFLLDLRAAVESNDRAKVAGMVQYPVRFNLLNGTHRELRTRQQLLAQYDFIFNAKTREAIHTQVPACMFARDQGAMIGDGEVWFQDDKGTFRIWSFNQTK